MALFSRRGALEKSYDAVADEYSRRFADELQHKPADRRLLDQFAGALAGEGPCIDLGCGPGHVTRYLHERGLDIAGIDLSGAMVKEAKRLHPDINFSRGDFRDLPAPDHFYSAAVAFYSLIHLSPGELVQALLEIRRVIVPGGALLLAFHVGWEQQHLEDWWQREVDLEFHFFPLVEMVVHLQEAGFRQERAYQRDPYPGEDSKTRRGYILAETLPGIPPARRRSGL
jgi:SAM-dependent methyltransferase